MIRIQFGNFAKNPSYLCAFQAFTNLNIEPEIEGKNYLVLHKSRLKTFFYCIILISGLSSQIRFLNTTLDLSIL